MNPMTVRLIKMESGRVETRLLDMCLTSGECIVVCCVLFIFKVVKLSNCRA